MKVISRKNWGARQPGPRTPNAITEDSTLFIHYSAFDGGQYDTVEEQKQCMRNMQNHHIDKNGWADIGYSYVVFQPTGRLKRPRVYEARRFGYVPAAQEGYNTGNGAVCVVAGPGEEIRPGTIRKLKAIARRFKGERIRGHKDVNSTSCPGANLYAKLREIEIAGRKKSPPYLK
jgi:hypothetical protein